MYITIEKGNEVNSLYYLVMAQKKHILIDNKPFFYDAIEMTYDTVGSITHEQAKEILFFTKQLLDEKRIKFGLIYGTLLGAIREHDFIAHDYDVDIYTADIKDLLLATPYLYEKGLKLCRVNPNRLYSYMKDDVYIDIYIQDKVPFPFNLWCYRVCNNIIPKKYLRKTEKINFLGKEFCIPANSEKLLEFLYGKTWRTPIVGDHGQGKGSVWLVFFLRKVKKNGSKFFQKLIKKLNE